MQLNREHWNREDGEEFKAFLLTKARGEKERQWEKNIVNTKLDCLALLAPEMKKIINEIAKGNFLEFIDLWMWDNYSLVNVIGGLIVNIKDFKLMEKYIYKFGSKIDNWANCDMLKFKITPKNKEQFFELSKNLIYEDKTFLRRIGVTILFKLIDDDNYIDEILTLLNGFSEETEYYVNMVNAWLICDCFIKQRDKTLAFLRTNNLNKFTINKAISKCRDSFRVSAEDKEMLLSFRVK